jgi:hypothetical protein
MTHQKTNNQDIELINEMNDLWYAESNTVHEMWADWEIRQALESGDVDRAADLAELKLSDSNIIWF